MEKNTGEVRNNAIKNYLKDHGITLIEFSKETGISYETTRKIIYGYTRIPSIRSMKMIYNAYPDLDPNTIYENLMNENKNQMEDLWT